MIETDAVESIDSTIVDATTNVQTNLIHSTFATFEDLSSRLVLLPFNDEKCTGAKVFSHDSFLDSLAVESPYVSSKCAKSFEEINISSESTEPENDCEIKAASELETINLEGCVVDGVDMHRIISTDDSLAVNKIGVVDSRVVSIISSKKLVALDQILPKGHVLVAMRILNSESENSLEYDSVIELNGIEFSEILSLLREATYPISLLFAPPTSFSIHPDIPSRSHASPQISMPQDTDGDDNATNQSMLVSREDAAKFAAQAATELRGRLTRWGFQAATRAVEAASAVQEMREERQRKSGDDSKRQVVFDAEIDTSTSITDNRDMSSSDAHDADQRSQRDTSEPTEANTKIESEPTDDATNTSNPGDPETDTKGPCSLFLESSSGFVQLVESEQILKSAPTSSSFPFSLKKQSPISVTNMSVITVRLSAREACPIGKNLYTFQWYRSRSPYAKDKNYSFEDWVSLRGATYAVYQPSASDVGYQVCCVVGFGDVADASPQRCILPFAVTTDSTLLESAKTTMLKAGSKNSATFSSLSVRGSSNDMILRTRIYVEIDCKTDSISDACIYIDQLLEGSIKALHNEPLTGVKAQAHPSRPRSFELTFPSNIFQSAPALSAILDANRILQLDAPSRKTRESLLVAVGLAGFKGVLSSILTDTILLPSTIDLDETYKIINRTTSYEQKSYGGSVQNLYTLQIEAQIEEMRSELSHKSDLVSKLQQKMIVAGDDMKKVERELISCRTLVREQSNALSNCIQESNEKDRSINELERTLKSLNNEKEVLSAAISARDSKVDAQTEQIKTLEKKLCDAISKVEASAKSETDKNRKEINSAAVIAEMKKEKENFQEELKTAQLIIDELNRKHASSSELASNTIDELEQSRSELKKLKMERNSLKYKCDSMSKELSKKGDRGAYEDEINSLLRTIHQLRHDNDQYQLENMTLRSEIRLVKEELLVTREAHQQSIISHQQPVDSDCTRAKKRCAELEKVLSNLSLVLDAKMMQITTLKQINDALVKEIDDNSKD